MDHNDIRHLIEKAVTPSAEGAVSWADLGSGNGAFTLALYELLREQGSSDFQIYSIDKSTMHIHSQKKIFTQQFGEGVPIHFISADFTKPLTIPPQDGILMANSLHFVRDKVPLLKSLRNLLKHGGTLVIVEYDIDEGNHFVPYPVSFNALGELTAAARFGAPELLATAPSEYWGQVYAGRISGLES
jgi:SAM-dependent methyltransferase